MIGLIGAFVLAFAVTALIGPYVIKKLRELKVGQKILEIGPKWHLNKQNIPTMGGFMFIIGLTVATLVMVFAAGAANGIAYLVVLGMALCFGAIGFLDDYKKVKKKQNLGLTAWQKSLLQLAVAILFISMMRWLGIVTPRIFIPFFNVSFEIPWIIYNVFMAFVIVGSVNAVNLTDGLDGLAAGVTLPVMLFFGAVTFTIGSISAISTSVLAFACAGALCGFLIYNFNPAKVFMGDTGSLFLGALVCGLAFAADMPVVLVPVGIVYIIETLSVIIQVGYFKLSHGKRIFKMAPIHHHFEMCGYSERKIVAVAFAITAVMCIVTYFGIYSALSF